jgi:hypothetical protein
VRTLVRYFKTNLRQAKVKLSNMDELFERFPHIGKQIFEELDNDNLTECREVCKSWQTFIDNEKITWNRILMKFPTGEGMYLTRNR